MHYKIYIPENDKEYRNSLFGLDSLDRNMGMLFDCSEKKPYVVAMENMKFFLDFIF
jgi:uncharacterized membrane protein (UPF0127 family)